ncbi:MAG TPA: acyl-CoA dehydrogenase family protein [Candidatus Dormibacteraeota bacterium]|nr:acyl-CoA dehydrogenase family protein [Candidatus Dormibacteraeota bacterium]
MMDFSFSDDQRLIRDTVRRFMDAEVRPSIRARDLEEKFASRELRKLGELGCCGMLVPESWGGAGADTVSYVLMLEEVARVDAAMAVALAVTNSLAALAVLEYGTEIQKEKYLRRLARGEILGSFCLTEPQAGSDAGAIAATADRRDSTYRLNGTKSWVTTGGEAGIYVVFAKTDPSAGARGVTAFLVEPSFPGFRVARYEDKMGLRTSRSAEIVFTDCEVPLENRLGEQGQGLKIALDLLDGGRVGIAAQALGIAQGALEASVIYARQRRAFGKTISEFQAVQWMLADMQTEIEAARGLVHNAAWVRDRSRGSGARPVGPVASRAKLYAGEMVNRVVYKAVQIHGSMGYSRESDVERMYRDARVLTIYEGTSEIQRMIIARDLLSSGAAAPSHARRT